MKGNRYRFIARIISKGRVTIPEELRNAESLEIGDIVELEFLRIVKKNTGQVYPRREDSKEVIEE